MYFETFGDLKIRICKGNTAEKHSEEIITWIQK